MRIERLNPPGLHPTPGYHHVTIVSEGRTGYLGPDLRPIQQGVRTGGTAVTVLCWPGDNLMIHAAV